MFLMSAATMSKTAFSRMLCGATPFSLTTLIIIVSSVIIMLRVVVPVVLLAQFTHCLFFESFY